jgi:hypothetical protein
MSQRLACHVPVSTTFWPDTWSEQLAFPERRLTGVPFADPVASHPASKIAKRNDS